MSQILMSQCERVINGIQCIYPVNHHGEHYAPGDGRDHSDEIRVKVLSDSLTALRERYRWRPIAEIHEDYGSVVLMNIEDPGDMELGSNLSLDFDESRWTHFSRIAPLGQEEYERLVAERAALSTPATGAAREPKIKCGPISNRLEL